MTIETKIVNALIKDLQSRKFLDHVFADPQENGEPNTNCGMDRQTFDSLKRDWRKIIKSKLPHPPPRPPMTEYVYLNKKTAELYVWNSGMCSLTYELLGEL